MATRAAAFAAKIRILKDYHHRIVHNVVPIPTGTDVANTLKYFSQTLLGVLKDVPNIPSETFGPRQRDSVRLSVFPNLNYSGLYSAVLAIIDVVPSVQIGQLALGEAILHTLHCLIPFLEYDLLDSIPYTVASTLASFPVTLQKETITLLSASILPVTLGHIGMHDQATYATDSVAAIIMMVFQYTDKEEFHIQILECLMSLKKDLAKDLLNVIAYGPPTSRAPAAHLLFRYWPQLNPTLREKRGGHTKLPTGVGFTCMRDVCVNYGKAPAVKVCLSPSLSIQSSRPPPLYLCSECTALLQGDPEAMLQDIVLPMDQVSNGCENKNCGSQDNTAVHTCFNMACASFNGNRPIRYCASCNVNRHFNKEGQHHVVQSSLPNAWSCDQELQHYLVEAIVSLLKEAQPVEEKKVLEMGEDLRAAYGEIRENGAENNNDDRKLLSRYGIWLLVELCKPKEDVPIDLLARLLGMLFQWFKETTCSGIPAFDGIGSALEKLKPEYIYNWLQEVSKTYFEVILSCLLPHPVEYARVGGHWDALASRTTQVKEGLNRLFCLVPYDIVTFEVWDYIMPYWMESIRTEVPADELGELKVLLNKCFDILMGPLPLLVDKMYHFVWERFEDPDPSVQEQALQWLQILSSQEVSTPLSLVVSMFKTGVQSLSMPVTIGGSGGGSIPGSPASSVKGSTVHVVGDDFNDTGVLPVTCFILMQDILLKQIELNRAKPHVGILDNTSKDMITLLVRMLRSTWGGSHTCHQEEPLISCESCELYTLWHQLCCKVIGHIVAKNEVQIPEKELPKVDEIRKQTQPGGRPCKASPSPPHEVPDSPYELKEEELPAHLQLMHVLLKELYTQSDPDVLFYVLRALKLLCLHAECLTKALKDREDYVKFCLKKFLMPELWKMLQAEHSQLAAMCVPVLLYCITLPSGSDIMWQLVEGDFNNEDWRARFSAVERVSVLARHLDPDCVKNNQVILTTLAHAFCILIESLNDVNAMVAQKAHIYLQTLKSASVQCICTCLEFQFDSVISDRCMILQRVYLLSTVLKDEDILSWEFFLNRFDTLSLEAQIDLESSGDISHPTDLISSDRESEIFQKKLNRARFALARTDSVRSLSASLLGKPPYRRAASMPVCTAHKAVMPRWKVLMYMQRWFLSNHHAPQPPAPSSRNPQGAKRDPIGDDLDDCFLLLPSLSFEMGSRKPSTPLRLCLEADKDKSCVRQQSAPQFGRRGTRFGLGMFGNYAFQGGYLREFTDQQSNFAALLQKAMDLEGVDRETVHKLTALLMKFIAFSDKAEVSEKDKEESHFQDVVIRHIYVLLGYNQSEKTFSVPPYKLRSSAVLNAFIAGLPHVLDRNFKLGTVMLPVASVVLQYTPSPQRYASDYQPPNYSLWYLEPHTRHSWLMALLAILYKYQYNKNTQIADTVEFLVQLTINTVAAQIHRCKKSDDGNVVASPFLQRSRDSVLDTSNVSMGELENIQETDTPPQSPTNSADDEGKVAVEATSGTARYNRGRRGAINMNVLEESGSEVEQSPKKVAQKTPRPLPDYSFQEDKECTSTDTSTGSEKTKSPTKPLTLEESFELHIMQKAKDQERLRNTGTSSSSPDSPVQGLIPALHYGTESHVERKMVQQIQEFEHHVEKTDAQKDTDTTDKSSSESVREEKAGTISPYVVTTANVTEVDPLVETVTVSVEPEVQQIDTLEVKIPVIVDDTEVAHEDDVFPPPLQFRQRRPRKTGLTTVEVQKIMPELGSRSSEQSGAGRRRRRKADLISKGQQMVKKQQHTRFSDQVIVDRCPECKVILEQYDEETISLCIVIMSTFIHREPAMAAPYLLDMLQCVARIAANSPYPWQTDWRLIIPGNSVSVARQFLRCALHQLAPNGIFPQLFQSKIEEPDFMKTMSAALMDFNELNCYAPLQFLLEGMNNKKTLPTDTLGQLLSNLANYMECIPLETTSPTWASILGQFDTFFRKLMVVISEPFDVVPIMKIMIAVLKIPGVNTAKSILEPFSKLLCFMIQNCTLQLQQLVDLCTLSYRVFVKERDKLLLSRAIVFELVQALKFRSSLPDANILLLVQFICLDAGGTIMTPDSPGDIQTLYNPQTNHMISTAASECMKQHLNDCMEFIADLHTLTKVKENMKGAQNLNEDTLGNQLKSGIGQFIALEFTKGNGRDSRAVNRYLPWLYHPPSAMQQGPREFIDCVTHIRMLSWLLLGSLTHTAITQCSGPIICQPIPLEASQYIADHVLVIMTGFVEQSKTSVLHMSSLFHAFILCQLWTMYCESLASHHLFGSELQLQASNTVMDFWARVTPGVLQLLSHTKMLAEMVNLHVLSLMETLQECQSTVLSKLFALWTPILHSYHGQLPGHIQVRLQTCQNWVPPKKTKDDTGQKSTMLLQWLKRLQFKLGQTEVQSSSATQMLSI